MSLHSKKNQLTEYQRACLRAILSGAVNALERRERHKTRGASVGQCPFCGCEEGEGEAVLHRWWSCPQWQHLRENLIAKLPDAPASMPTCFAECGLLRENGAQKWNLVEDIQLMMLNILCECCLLSDSSQKPDDPPGDDGVDGNDGSRRDEGTPQPPVDPNFRAHQLITLPNAKLQCQVCKRTCVQQRRNQPMQSSCRGRDLTDSGSNPASLSRCDKNRKILMEKWEKSKPGGHSLSWDGDVKGYIRCSICTKSWPYKRSGRMSRKSDILEVCAGSPAAAEQLRSSVKRELSKTQSQHNLFVEPTCDQVTCGKCGQSFAFVAWKKLANTPCKAVSRQQHAGTKEARKGRGRSVSGAPD